MKRRARQEPLNLKLNDAMDGAHIYHDSEFQVQAYIQGDQRAAALRQESGWFILSKLG